MIYVTSNLRVVRSTALSADYIDNTTEYPTNIKKIYVKGASNKFVPRQVMPIKSVTFNPNQSQIQQTIDKEFREI